MTPQGTYFMIYNEWKRIIPEGEYLLRMENGSSEGRCLTLTDTKIAGCCKVWLRISGLEILKQVLGKKSN